MGESAWSRRRSSLPILVELALRVVGAVLQISATAVIVRVLEPMAAGIYMRGLIITFTLAALLRYRYELFIAPRIAGDSPPLSGVTAGALLVRLSQRFLVRCALVCAVLLVITADLDVLEPHPFPYLETYLPFVLAIPFAGLAQMLASALRAAERSVLAMMCSAYTVNVAILCAAMAGQTEAPLQVLAWAFLGGCVFAAALACFFAWRLFRDPGAPANLEPPTAAAWYPIYDSVAANSAIAIALTLTWWGPAAVLAVLASPEEIAAYVACARTALAADILLPALTFVLCAERPIVRWPEIEAGKARSLFRQMGTAGAISAVVLLVLLLTAPKTLSLYGEPYRGLIAVYVILLIAHWLNGTGRPAVRYLVAHWKAASIRRILEISALSTVLVCAAGLGFDPPMAAAVAMLVGSLVANTLAAGAATRSVQSSDSGRQGAA